MAGNDLSIYEREAAAWWDADSRTFRSLRAVKRFHEQRIVEALHAHVGARFACAVDLGCGGGLLSVALAAHGERVIGVDTSAASLAVARDAARRLGRACVFVRGDVCDVPLASGSADLVALSDVIEHVADKGRVLAEAARLVRPGGLVYVNTLARGWRARLFAVEVAERLGYVPRGTHDARLFVDSAELVELARAVGLECRGVGGEAPRLCATVKSGALEMRRSNDTKVSYHAWFVRSAA